MSATPRINQNAANTTTVTIRPGEPDQSRGHAEQPIADHQRVSPTTGGDIPFRTSIGHRPSGQPTVTSLIVEGASHRELIHYG